jgi:hypothetical protein
LIIDLTPLAIQLIAHRPAGPSFNTTQQLIDLPPSFNTTQQVPQSFSSGEQQEPFSWDASSQQGSRGHTRNGLASSNSSVGSSITTGWSRKEPDIDVILEKIKLQQGVKQDWNEEKLRKLAGNK